MKKENNIIKIIYKIELIGIKLLILIFKILGMNISSFIISILLPIIGFTFLIKRTFLAYINIKHALKIKSKFKILKIIFKMWIHLGRNIGEFIFFATGNYKNLSKYLIMDEETEKNFKKISQSKKGTIIVTAHFGNWETFSTIINCFDIRVSAIYRDMNNKYVNELILKYRERKGSEMIPKGEKGIIRIVKTLKQGKPLYMLVDQRLKTGIKVPFFNIPSKTVQTPSIFALKNNCDIYTYSSVRRNIFLSKFDIKIKKINIIKTDNIENDIKTNTININKEIESWIVKNPEQYFWVYDKWKIKKKK